jgi:hypothetical protein
MDDIRKLWKFNAVFREDSQESPRNGMNIILSAGNNKTANFILEQVSIKNCLLILNTVHPLDHLLKAACCPRRMGVASTWASAQCTSPSLT